MFDSSNGKKEVEEESSRVIESKEYSKLTADVLFLKSKIESLVEMNKAESERSSNLTGQIGELRGMINNLNRNISGIEVKAIKAIDIVESVEPDKLAVNMQKTDGKIEAIIANIESNEEMMKALMEQLKQIRAQIEVFRGAEQILKLNEEVKRDIMTIKKISAICEQHADKVETMFIEMQKTFSEYNYFSVLIDNLDLEFKEVISRLIKLESKFPALVTKKDLSNNMTVFDKNVYEAKKLLEATSNQQSKLAGSLNEAKRELEAEFELKLDKAELLSDAFKKLIEDNPTIVKDLDMENYLNKKVKKLEIQLLALKEKEDLMKNRLETKSSLNDKETNNKSE